MEDVKSAMRDKDQMKLNTLRFLQSAVKNREIEMRPNPITEDEVMGVIKKLVKQRKESIEQYQNGGRQDLADQEASELKILESYLPAQMSRDQIEKLVADVISAVGAKTVKDMGPVMKEVIARSKGTADNKTVSEVIRSKLT
jgi:uncharacterized protein